jgi:outer membrane lipoprotein-sorting protein
MMENRKDFHHDDSPTLERAVEAILRDPIPGELPPERVAQLVAVVRRAADQPYTITLIERIKNMKRTTRIAVVASAAIVFFGLLSWIVPGGGPTLAFADVAEAINGIHTATWKLTETFKPPQGKPRTTTSVGMFMAPDKERTERQMSNTDKTTASIEIFDCQANRFLVLNQVMKTAMVIDFKSLPAPMPPPFVGFRDMIASAKKSGKSGEYERLGSETIDGHRAEVFRYRSNDTQEKTVVETKIWADLKTSLPVRIETSVRGKFESDRVMTGFQYDVDLDPALFRVEVPDGYAVRQSQMDFSKGPLSLVAEALGMAAENNGGVFPATLTGDQGIDGIMQRAATDLWKKHGIEMKMNEDPPKEELEKIQKLRKEDIEQIQKETSVLVTKLPAVIASLHAIRRHGDWHYAGKDVKLGTPSRPIFWSKFGKRYQVIYADLSVKEVSPQDVPKVPQSEGSPP